MRALNTVFIPVGTSMYQNMDEEAKHGSPLILIKAVHPADTPKKLINGTKISFLMHFLLDLNVTEPNGYNCENSISNLSVCDAQQTLFLVLQIFVVYTFFWIHGHDVT